MTYIRATQARARGLGRGGIVFSDRLDKDAHLRRVQHADVFLDSEAAEVSTERYVMRYEKAMRRPGRSLLR